MNVVSAGSHYDNETRRQAAANFVVYGNQTKVAEVTGVPVRTISEWTRTEWWEELTTKLRQEKQEELDAVITQTIHKALDQTLDRINEGDYILNKDNQLVRKPMNGRDLATVMAINFDKRQILRNQPTSINSSVSNDQLLDLKAQFEKLAGKTIEGERVE